MLFMKIWNFSLLPCSVEFMTLFCGGTEKILYMKNTVCDKLVFTLSNFAHIACLKPCFGSTPYI